MPMWHTVLGPGAIRFCFSLTNVPLQFTTFVNNQLASVMGCLDTHCIQGALIPIYGPKNVFVHNILAITAPGDSACPDFICAIPKHITKLPWPLLGSFNTFLYAGGFGAKLGALSKIL